MAEPNETHQLLANLDLPRCPHCGIAEPFLKEIFRHHNEARGFGQRHWVVYECAVCKGLVTCWSVENNGRAIQIFPASPEIDENLPKKPGEYLKQARESIGQPAASVVMSASAVDAMLKRHGLTKGSLYSRIDQAAKDHLITKDMAKWAHQVRLDANDQRHADEDAPLPEQEDAERCLTFALALADLLFVLPARVTRGISDATKLERNS